MVKAVKLLNILKNKGFNFFSGVPCSILEPLLKSLYQRKDLPYVPAVRENVALGLANGAYLAGKNSAVFIQNSGLGNIINALTSFNLIYKIPVLIFITWRGYQGKDAPEHIIMGKKTLNLLRELNIPYIVLSKNYRVEINRLIILMRKTKIPAAIILKEGTVIE